MIQAPETPFDPLKHCLTCKKDLVIRAGVIELSGNTKIPTTSRWCPHCMCERLDGLPWTQPVKTP